MVIKSGVLKDVEYEVKDLNRCELLIKVTNNKTNNISKSIVQKIQGTELNDEINRVIINTRVIG